jgi:DNA-binding protein HU-beta
VENQAPQGVQAIINETQYRKGFQRNKKYFQRSIQTNFTVEMPVLTGLQRKRTGQKKFCQNQKAYKFVCVKKFFKNSIMNKAELIAKIAEDADVTKTQANAALDSFISAVTKTLKGNGKVTLVGFGTFSVSKRAARNGRNPQTGEVIKIKAKKVARFKAGKDLTSKL